VVSVVGVASVVGVVSTVSIVSIASIVSRKHSKLQREDAPGRLTRLGDEHDHQARQVKLGLACSI
jgi:hypothetical protein